MFIVIINGVVICQGLLNNTERFSAFADTLQANGIAFDQTYYYHGNYREKSGYQAAKLMILSNDYPEVLVCANDNMAIGAMKAFEEHRISVPQHISITGFDDSDAAALAGLTTIKIPRYESGFLAAKELLELIKGNVNRDTVKIGASIIWRQSVRS
ncbi:DNA-binding LacI/PurR family transcriptional regulator [Paenibacillus harenae]|uniref:DNA-binding LacI/PurR family transcriptional regulator n=1 Tax=Paenibacillus harenae TaxID=306543 RepID=A0ABT9U4E8_PAEHA|nr:DNA-binding LacI/PurR family transcriptional regulator [Paenibacillus harenae]